MNAPFPKSEDYAANPESLKEVELLQSVIVEIRKARSQMQLPRHAEITLRTLDVSLLERHAQGLKDLCNVSNIQQGDKDGPSSTIVVGEQEIYIPLAGLIDLDAEKQRLDKEIAAASKDISFLDKRLNNPKYVSKAPAHLVEETRDKHAAALSKLESLKRARAEF